MRSFIPISFILTTPLAAQWQIQNTQTVADLHGVHSLGNDVAWVSGSDGTVLRTENAGVVWQVCAVPPLAEHLDFRGIQAFDRETAIVMSSGKGELSRLYKTTDGCKSWTLLFTNPDKTGSFTGLSIPVLGKKAYQREHAYGLLLGAPVDGHFALFYTQDSGTSWVRRTAQKRSASQDCQWDTFGAHTGEAAFAASNQSLLSFRAYFLFVTGGQVARLAYTDHYDLDFAFCHDSSKFVDLPFKNGSPSAGAFAAAADEPDGFFPRKLMIVGGDSQRPADGRQSSVLISSKSGFHVPSSSYLDIRRPTTPPNGYRSAVAYDKPHSTWITVGPNGTDISTDDGRNWRALKPKISSGDRPDADQHWNALSLPFVVGPDGRIGKLSDFALAP